MQSFFSFRDRFQVEKFVKLSLQDFVVGCVVLHIGHYEMMYTIDQFFAIFLKSEEFAKVTYLGKCSHLQYTASGRYSFHMRIRYTFEVINETRSCVRLCYEPQGFILQVFASASQVLTFVLEVSEFP